MRWLVFIACCYTAVLQAQTIDSIPIEITETTVDDPLAEVVEESLIRSWSIIGSTNTHLMLEINDQYRTLAVGERAEEGLQYIGMNESGMVLIEQDGDVTEYPMGYVYRNAPTETIAKIEQKPKELASIRIYPNHMGMYFTRGFINSRRVQFLVDTGATSVAMNSRDAQRLGIAYQNGRKVAVSTASDVVQAFEVSLSSLKIGQIELQRVRGLVIEGAQPSEILLGMSALRGLDIIRQDGYMELREREQTRHRGWFR